jgi:hypothetical protein
VAALAGLYFWPKDNPPRSASLPGPPFDPSVVPLINDAQRRSLSTYSGRPDAKAIAIAYDTVVVVDGAADLESARQAALQQCQARTRRACRIYAAGMNVTWSHATIPLPAPGDLRTTPLSLPLVVGEIPLIRAGWRKEITERHIKEPAHRALALSSAGFHMTSERRSQAEAARMTLEGCSEYHHAPCLILSIDNQLTMQIPRMRKLDRIFLPSVEPELPVAQRERIGKIYQGADWRALATGKNGAWEAVSGAASEADAIAGALKACEQVDRECRLYAIGNFHVAEQ